MFLDSFLNFSFYLSGDPIAKVASQASHLLTQVITSHHPHMKSVVVKEVERLLFRPNITPRTEYYCLCFLSEMIFTASVDQALANRLVQTYFTIFNRCTKKGEVNNKTMSVLLAGVTRAFPYSKLEVAFLEKYVDTFYRLLHYVSLNTAIQTLALIFSLVNFGGSGGLTDRFYSTLYRFIFRPGLDRCSKCSMLLNLVYRAVKRDQVLKRVRAFVKQLLQVALVSSSAFIVGALILISETVRVKLGFRIEPDVFAKLVANVADGEADVATAEKTEETSKPKDVNLMFSKFANDDDDDDQERYFDVDEDAKEEDGKKEEPKESTGGWVFREESKKLEKKVDNTNYQINARNPLYAAAEGEQLWELSLLSRHFHPTTRLFTSKLLAGETIDYDGDPIEDFTLKRFLDKFVFKNPKQVDEGEPKKVAATFSVFGRKKTAGKRLTAEEMMSKSEEEVPVDEQYIHRFLKQKKILAKSLGKDGGDDEIDDASDVESVTSLEFNDILDNYESYANEGEMDFAGEVRRQPKKKKKGKKDSDDEDDEDDDEFDFDDEDVDFDEEMSDEELEECDTGSFKGDDYDVDYSDIEDDGDEAGVATSKRFKKYDLDFGDDKKNKKGGVKKNFSAITNDIFASAEEFAHLLDGNSDDSDFEGIDDQFDLGEEPNDDEAQTQNGKGNAKGKSKKNAKRKRPNLGRNRKKKRVNLD